jgi:hypothetical protein
VTEKEPEIFTIPESGTYDLTYTIAWKRSYHKMIVYRRNSKKRKYQYVVKNKQGELLFYYGRIPWSEIPDNHEVKKFSQLLHEVRLRL